MNQRVVLKEYNHVKQMKQKYELALQLLEDSFCGGTYFYQGIHVFVREIDIENELLLISTCDGSMPFLSGTDDTTSVYIKEFINEVL